MPKLIFISAKLSGQVFELTREKTTVGRGDQNALVIHDSSVSLQHCEILVNGGEVILCDLNSQNGTFVDGLRLQRQSQVRSGQTMRFGLVEARLELDPVSDESDTSARSAIYAHGKVMREQSRARQQSAPPKPSAHVHVGSDSGQDEPTIMLRAPELPARASTPPAQEKIEGRTGKRATKYVVIAAGLALILIGLLWRMWGRK